MKKNIKNIYKRILRIYIEEDSLLHWQVPWCLVVMIS